MIKVLQIVPGLEFDGGIQTFAINYFLNMNRNEISMDFVTHSCTELSYKTEIENKGGKVFILHKFKKENWKIVIEEIEELFKNNTWDIIHCNCANMGYFYFKAALRYKKDVKLILHSHQNSAGNMFIKRLRNVPLLLLAKKKATHYFAASKQAGDFLFNNKDYIIITNGININKFKYSETERNKIRLLYHIDNDTILLGNVGRLVFEKNQEYLFKIMNYINDDSIKLMIIGNGALRNTLINRAKEMGVEKKIIFVSTTKEISKYYSAIDLFLLPSLYEGLGIALIEAQTSGLPCIVSKYVPSVAKVSNTFDFLGIEDSDISSWINRIWEFIKIKNNRKEALKDNWELLKEYDITYCAHKLEKIYKKIVLE